ncbi:hypothetical protein R1sor_004256 [Riccia sorocarpa]|uniref:Uncharacterized protein n=1 Tax=Riccia sorocarpa TaxID=122646 RepID=A0ABD3H6T5_9MARC
MIFTKSAFLPWEDNLDRDSLLAQRIRQLEHREEDLTDAQEKLKAARLKNKARFDKTHRLCPRPIQVGDWVLVYDSSLENQHSTVRKFSRRWFGPYVVLAVHDNTTYSLRELDGTPLRIQVAGKRVKLFRIREGSDELEDFLRPSEEDADDFSEAEDLIWFEDMASSTSVGASTSADATGSGAAASSGAAGIGFMGVDATRSTVPPGVVPPMDATGILQALATLIRQQPVGEMRSTKALQSVVRRLGRFDGREVSHYLREYQGEMVLAKVSDTETVANFELVVEPELRDRVREIARRFIVVLGGWELFEHAMKEEFLEEDTKRITRRTFLDWVERRPGLTMGLNEEVV